MSQVKPLVTGGAPIWEHESSDYPDLLKVPMEDGHVVTYRREITQPEPRVLKAIDLIKVMKRNTYGGNGYISKHAK
jgi:hypothetical protein